MTVARVPLLAKIGEVNVAEGGGGSRLGRGGFGFTPFSFPQ